MGEEPQETQLTARGLGKRFGRRIVFRKLDFDAVGGTTTAITGPNGCGKSTLVRVLAGVMRPTKGHVEAVIRGKAVSNEDRPFETGLVAPYLNLYERFSPAENLRFIARARGLKNTEDRIEAVLDEVGLGGRSHDLVGTFSSGMIQRARFAVALFTEPQILLLDEPTSNLDEVGVATVHRLIASSVKADRIVIIATNDPAEAASCQSSVCISDFQ